MCIYICKYMDIYIYIYIYVCICRYIYIYIQELGLRGLGLVFRVSRE